MMVVWWYEFMVLMLAEVGDLLFADLTRATATTVNQLRYAFATQDG